ncbi:hypothetical protein Leryth_000293 [Lithospermum erythrorhizon]|nr:hypothetical protein Leryth_000293 [Lithospermum erythrorhizon]
MAAEQMRFTQAPPMQQPPPPLRKRWAGCWGGLSCFGKQKGGKRIVPATRITDANTSANQPNGAQVAGLNNPATALGPSLLAPPSSPASFSNSALQSTAQSPNCFLSANSPGGPSSSMYATGPYAHETQLVSPPVFSTFTTEPSTAPLTPPPELAHLTTPSSPDVPFARFLPSAADIKGTGKSNYMCNDLQATYSLYPGSPESHVSPVSRVTRDNRSSSFPERDFPSQWDSSTPPQELNYGKSNPGQLFGLQTDGASKLSDSNFFCPATFAQFYLDQSSFPQSGGRISVSRESDAYSNAGNGHQNRQTKTFKQDAEELEAYRASFGFSADEIVTTSHYVEITEGLDEPFTITPLTPTKDQGEAFHLNVGVKEGQRLEKLQKESPSPQFHKLDPKGDVSVPTPHAVSDDEGIFSRMKNSRSVRKYDHGLYSSDAEIEYKRGRSLRERKANLT